MPERFQRRSIRLKGYDYAQAGACFVTICAHERAHLFGRVADGEMMPNALGAIVQRCWDAIPEHMPMVVCDAFVVMPNHVHGILMMRERVSDVRGDARGGAVDVGARHDAPDMNASDAPDTNALDAPGIGARDAHGETTKPTDAPPDDPGSGMPGGDPDTSGARAQHTRARHDDDGANAHAERTRARHDDTADTHAQHTRARHDAPLRDPRKPPGIPRGALGQVVASYKSAVTRLAYRDGLLPHGTPVWQRNYWDRVIRDDGEYQRIAKYIRDNPMNWKGDRFNER